jgi:hypothetical protein
MNTQHDPSGDFETLMRRMPNTDDAVTLTLFAIRGQMRGVAQAYDAFRGPASMTSLEAFIERREQLLSLAREARANLDALIQQIENPDFGKDGH